MPTEERVSWQPAEVLDAALRISLRELNARFLACLQRMPEEALAELGFAANVARLLRAADAESVVAIAACPYALWDASFRAHEFWKSVCVPVAQAGAEVRPQREMPGYAQEYLSLSEMALFFAWHVATTNALATRLVLGMSAATAELIRSSTLPVVASAVRVDRLLLRPRWPQRTLYWRRLLALTPQSTFEEMRLAQLVGIQLMATEQKPEIFVRPAARTGGRSPTATSR